MESLDHRAKTRERMFAGIPRWYNPWLHLASTAGIGTLVLVASIMFISHPRWQEVLIVPTVFVFANFYEWLVHRKVLHKRFWPFEVIYERHTPEHHVVYIEEEMEIQEWREFRFVLIPAAGVLGIVIIAAPLAVLLAKLWSPNAGWFFLVTSSLYMVAYELSHLSYHLPKTSFIGRQRIVQILRAHHARHHHPRLMQKANFNVTVPLFDWLLGTMASNSELKKTPKK